MDDVANGVKILKTLIILTLINNNNNNLPE